MSFSLVLFIIIQLAALIFFLEMLRRVHKRINEYYLKENKRTLPFGFVRLRYVIIIYIISYGLWLILSFFVYFTYINGDVSSVGAPSTGTRRGVDLNL